MPSDTTKSKKKFAFEDIDADQSESYNISTLLPFPFLSDFSLVLIWNKVLDLIGVYDRWPLWEIPRQELQLKSTLIQNLQHYLENAVSW